MCLVVCWKEDSSFQQISQIISGLEVINVTATWYVQCRLICYASRPQSYNLFPPKTTKLGKGLISLQTTMMTITAKTVTENLENAF